MSATTYSPPHQSHARTPRIDATSSLRGRDPLASMLAGADLREAAGALVGSLESCVPGTKWAIGVTAGGGGCELQAVADVTRLDPSSGRVRDFEAALDEVALRGETFVYCDGERDGQAAQTIARLNGVLATRWVMGGPFRHPSGDVVGGWICWGDSDTGLTSAEALLREQGAQLAAALRIIQRANQSAIAKALASLREYLAASGSRRWWLVLLIAVAAVMAMPMRYQIGCDCRVEPVYRRFVAAPFDATLESSRVEPGDTVQRDGLMAKLDGREIRWEIAALEADYAQARKSRDAALADRKAGASQLAQLEMSQLENRLALLKHRIAHLEIRSPCDGVVISGDLQRVEGAPVTVGETLFEIAPLEEVIIEIAIPERDVTYVREGAAAAVRLDACPGDKLAGTVAQLHPRAEIRDTDQVFIAEVHAMNEDGRLRPGMNGRAKIRGPWRPVGWIFFHRPWQAVVRWLGW